MKQLNPPPDTEESFGVRVSEEVKAWNNQYQNFFREVKHEVTALIEVECKIHTARTVRWSLLKCSVFYIFGLDYDLTHMLRSLYVNACFV